jgi:hypothetical protein
MKRRLFIGPVSVIAPGVAPDVSFVPPLMRRRLSPLQKMFFALAKEVEKEPSASTVFASCDGEDTLTRRIVDDFHADGSVSPNRFSSSVYNAAPGLWSVFTKNRAPYTAVAAGDDTIECGILELLAGKEPAMLVYAEETGGGYGAAACISEKGECAVDVDDGDPSRNPVDFAALSAFLLGETAELNGRYVSLRRV